MRDVGKHTSSPFSQVKAEGRAFQTEGMAYAKAQIQDISFIYKFFCPLRSEHGALILLSADVWQAMS